MSKKNRTAKDLAKGEAVAPEQAVETAVEKVETKVIEMVVPADSVKTLTEIAKEVIPSVTVTKIEDKRAPGRPITEVGIKKQEERALKAAQGKLKRGRPVENESERQIRLTAMAERAKQNPDGMPHRGRPKSDPAVLEAVRAERKAAKAQEELNRIAAAKEILKSGMDIANAAAEVINKEGAE